MDTDKTNIDGQEWLKEVRRLIQEKFHNGSIVKWGSNDVLEPYVTVADIERISSRAAIVAVQEIFKHLENNKNIYKSCKCFPDECKCGAIEYNSMLREVHACSNQK